MNMSFRAKSAWAQLVATGVIFVPYFVYIGRLVRGGELTLPHVVSAFIGAIVMQIVLSIVYHVVIAISTRHEPKDERDVAIEGHALRNAYWVLLAAVMIVVLGGTMLAPLFAPLSSVVFIGQLALLCIVLGELTNYGTQVYYYGRGSE